MFNKITDEQLDKAIKITVILIIGSVISFAGYYLYSHYFGATPTVVEKAILETEKTVRANPNSHTLRVRLADLYFSKKRYGDAIEQYKIALDLKKKYGPALVGLGMSYMQKGEDKQAEKYFNQEIATASKHEMAGADNFLEKAYYYSGVLNVDRDDYKKALEFFKKSNAIKASASDTHLYIGFCYLNLKQYDKAIAELKIAVSFEPKYPEGLYYLGQAYAGKGDKNHAKEQYNKAIKYYKEITGKNYSDAQDALDKLE
ncbi:MAG: tetratricopeptide repeat protein [Actinobacteria bacterium]|nr:MAG: tetratricopeptide repeat protein [Actinomycetota bacterium]